MREILFRGKRIDTGEWVYGYYCKAEMHFHSGDEHFIIEYSCDGSQYRVDPATVGQYTGLTDKNGVKVFEGDIIWGTGSKANMDNFVIRWSEAICGFTAGEGKRVWPNMNQSTISAYEVVGNIHDNPERMEAENEAD